MRPFALAALLVLSAALAPLADARHAGPCTHEYLEAVRTRDLEVILATVTGECVDRLVETVCGSRDPCLP